MSERKKPTEKMQRTESVEAITIWNYAINKKSQDHFCVSKTVDKKNLTHQPKTFQKVELRQTSLITN